MTIMVLNEDRYDVNISEEALNVKVFEIATLATPSGSGDMEASVFDPTSVASDAFDMDNMAEGVNNILVTSMMMDEKRDLTNYTFGNVTNNTEFEDDGTLTMSGTATVWEDIQGSLIGRRLFSNQGRVDYSYAENAIVFSDDGDITDDNDCIIWNYQYPHKAKADGELRMHMHYELSGPLDYEFTLRYRVQETGGLKTDVWEEVVVLTANNNIFTYTLGVLNQITTLAEIDMTGYGISSQIQFRLTRTDSNGGVVNVTFVDGHYESDGLGSDEEFVK